MTPVEEVTASLESRSNWMFQPVTVLPPVFFTVAPSLNPAPQSE